MRSGGSEYSVKQIDRKEIFEARCINNEAVYRIEGDRDDSMNSR